MRTAIAMLLTTMAAAGTAVAQDESALVARGEYLMNGPVACGNCHTPRDEKMLPIMDKALSGGFHLFDPAGIDAYAANITPDPETGIGNWTDEEIIVAIREGKTPDGQIVFPPMPVPTYNNMSDDDARALVAYLRTVKPIHNVVPESKYKIPQQAMPPAKGRPAPPASDKVAYGGYIVTALAHCMECHTPFTADGMPDMAKAGAGGFEIVLGPDITVMTPNITSDAETGIGSWSDEDIKSAIVAGVRPDGGQLSPPMPYANFANMTAEDLDAVVAFLRTIPPVANKVERTAFQKAAFP